MIDVRWPQEQYARTAGWPGQRFPLLPRLLARFSGDTTQHGGEAGFVYRAHRAPPTSTASDGQLADRLSQRASQTLGVIDIRQSQQHHSRSAGWLGQSVPLLNALLSRYRADRGAGTGASGLVYRLAGASSAREAPPILANESPVGSFAGSAPSAAERGESSPPSTAGMRVRRKVLPPADDAVSAAAGKRLRAMIAFADSRPAVGGPSQPAALSRLPVVDASGSRLAAPDAGAAATPPLVARRALSPLASANRVRQATGESTATVVGERTLVTRGLADGSQLPDTADIASTAPGRTDNTVANAAPAAADHPPGMVDRLPATRPAASRPELVVARRAVDKPGSSRIETASAPLATSATAWTGVGFTGEPVSMQTRREVLPPSDNAIPAAIDKRLAAAIAVEAGGPAADRPNQPAAPSALPFMDASGNRQLASNVERAATLPLVARRQALSPLASGNTLRQATGESLATVVIESTVAAHGSMDDSQLPRFAPGLARNAVTHPAPAADHPFAASDRLPALRATTGGSESVVARRIVDNSGSPKGETVGAAPRAVGVAVPTGVGLTDGLVFVQAGRPLPPSESTPPMAARPASPLVRESAAPVVADTVSGLVWRKGVATLPTTQSADRVTADATRTAAVAASPTDGGMLSTSADSQFGASAPGSHPSGAAAAPNWEQLIAQVSRRILRQMTIERERRGWKGGKGWN